MLYFALVDKPRIEFPPSKLLSFWPYHGNTKLMDEWQHR